MALYDPYLDDGLSSGGLSYTYDHMIPRPLQIALTHGGGKPVYVSISHRIYGRQRQAQIPLAEFAKHLDAIMAERGPDGERVAGFMWWLHETDKLTTRFRAGTSTALLEYRDIIRRVLDPAAHACVSLDGIWALCVVPTIPVTSTKWSDDCTPPWHDPTSQLLSPDITRDGLVDTRDLLEVLGRWGPVPQLPDGSCDYADMNRDGRIDTVDELRVLAWFGAHQ